MCGDYRKEFERIGIKLQAMSQTAHCENDTRSSLLVANNFFLSPIFAPQFNNDHERREKFKFFRRNY